ncbi:uncharacterized protein BDZ99DRAFT_443486 [Mytilinidion resinicola]|uniref:Ubiquitin-like domain-containing protein n=1 Tax=Mytilinidion resinicola TaxID=574789 RepID=A0A6A6YKA5_9PEZI|nr:uncharacterized protein BDZ99DRAFT_443486 [Mytilinidion resinicola]KAF2809292.1 hypothetical protein BDZ99DRAFT_443486 [Mytilinidion resinicola]
MAEAQEEVAKEKGMEEYEKNVAKLAPPSDEMKPAVQFLDAIGREFTFPWHLAKSWSAMKELINTGFAHVEGLNKHVFAGHYDLAGPDGEIMLPQVWEALIEPGMTVKMILWPEIPPPPSSIGLGMPGPLLPVPDRGVLEP